VLELDFSFTLLHSRCATRELEGTQDTGALSESWRHDKGINVLTQGGVDEVPVVQAHDVLADTVQEARCSGNAAAYDDALRGEDVNDLV
jgi:hypothetical protein